MLEVPLSPKVSNTMYCLVNTSSLNMLTTVLGSDNSDSLSEYMVGSSAPAKGSEAWGESKVDKKKLTET